MSEENIKVEYFEEEPFDGVNVPLEVQIPTAFREFIDDAVERGMFPSPREVVCEALKALSLKLVRERVQKTLDGLEAEK